MLDAFSLSILSDLLSSSSSCFLKREMFNSVREKFCLFFHSDDSADREETISLVISEINILYFIISLFLLCSADLDNICSDFFKRFLKGYFLLFLL